MDDWYDTHDAITGEPIDHDWTSPENPLERALLDHRYMPFPPDRVCSCGDSPDRPPQDVDGDYLWWINHLKANI